MLLYIYRDFAGRYVSDPEYDPVSTPADYFKRYAIKLEENPSVSIYYVHKGLVVWTTTTVMLWQVKPAKMKKSRQDSSVPEKVHTVHKCS